MISSLFRTVLLVNIKMALPLLLILLLVHVLQKRIKSQLIYRMEKYVIIGMWLSIVLTHFGAVMQITMPATNFSHHLAQNTLAPDAVLPQPNLVSKSDFNMAFFNPQFDIVWAGITCLFLLVFVYQNGGLFFGLKHNRIAASTHIMKISTDLCTQINVKTPPAIFISNDIISPQTVGWLHPVVMLPFFNFPKEIEKQKLLLLHELYHYKDKDNCWKFFMFLTAAICWFNPLVWILWNSFLVECELACDEKVLERASLEEKRLYSEMLIFFSDSEQTTKLVTALQSELGSNFRAVKLRVEQISFTEPRHMNGRFIYAYTLILLLLGVLNVQLHPGAALSVSFASNYTTKNNYVNEGNLGGYAQKSSSFISAPKQSFQLPFLGATVFNLKDIDEDGNIYRNILYVLASKTNEMVTAGHDGIVVAAQAKDINELDGEELRLSSLGKYAIVDYGDGITVRYTFLSSVAVHTGQTVSAGDILGVVGHTGASYGDIDQCGIYVMKDGTMVDPLLFFDIDVPVQIIS